MVHSRPGTLQSTSRLLSEHLPPSFWRSLGDVQLAIISIAHTVIVSFNFGLVLNWFLLILLSSTSLILYTDYIYTHIWILYSPICHPFFFLIFISTLVGNWEWQAHWINFSDKLLETTSISHVRHLPERSWIVILLCWILVVRSGRSNLEISKPARWSGRAFRVWGTGFNTLEALREHFF